MRYQRAAEMKESGRAIGLIMLLICFLWTKTYPSTCKVQPYVSTSGSLILQQEKSSSFFFAQQMEDSIKLGGLDSMKLKDPNKAIFYAFIPGILIHGSGHFYAGKTKTGFWLLGAEVVGAYLVFTAALAELPGGEYDPDDELWGFAGLLLFVGSWVYDVVKSPIVVKKQNKELLQKRQSLLNLQMKNESLRLILVSRF